MRVLHNLGLIVPFAMATLFVLPGTAQAEDAAADKSISTADLSSSSDDAGSAFMLGAKIGGVASFNGLSPYPHYALELGYVFSTLNRGLGVFVGVDYTAPSAKGGATEETSPERVTDGTYFWELRQKELVFAPTLMYRITTLSTLFTPYIGIGPRMYFLQSVVTGTAGDQDLGESTEQSTKLGLGLPIGTEIAVGPGGILVEILAQWDTIDHHITGDSHLAGTSAFLGYRALL